MGPKDKRNNEKIDKKGSRAVLKTIALDHAST